MAKLRNESRGVGLPDGWVPATSFFLVRGEVVVGTCSIRHRLTPALEDFGGHIGYRIRPSVWNRGYGTRQLALALERARAMGIDRVRITCDQDNAASARVIEKNGGVLESESYSPGARRVTRRYWIEQAEP